MTLCLRQPKFFAICVFLLGLLRFAHAQERDLTATAHAIAENEKKFYEMGQDAGTKAAFLQFLADDSIVFHPGPVNGKQEWAKRPEKGISLKWHPLFVAVSRSADLGYTTGPAEWRHEKEDENPFGFGQYITIWKKQPDGTFKVALDAGSEVPSLSKTQENEIEYSISEAPAPANPDRLAISRTLRNAEGKFANAAHSDSTAGLLGSASESIRVQREGVFPAVGRAAAGLMLSVRRGELTQERLGGATSEAGDLAYSYGKYTLVRPEKTERGSYLQIWRVEKDGAWRIWLDYQSPLPNEQKK
ncbi:MAG TPA: nuclear transport factor 2 family protein [Chthoniobacterales bacterium]